MIRIRTFPRAELQVALFDFDGTLSLIREGWQEVMVGYMLEKLRETDSALDPAATLRQVKDFVTRLTGKQTIYQMIRLAEEIVRRGGQAEDPLVYKREYHDRLWEVIRDRVKGLENGRFHPEDWLVPGSVDLLEKLRRRKLMLYLASGTDRGFVVREVRLLRLEKYFDGRIYGALDNYRDFSKRILIQKLLAELELKGSELVGFGDGYVEIEEVKNVGGIAVGVASNERTRTGYDEWKKGRLVEAGADLIIPHFEDSDPLLEALGL